MDDHRLSVLGRPLAERFQLAEKRVVFLTLRSDSPILEVLLEGFAVLLSPGVDRPGVILGDVQAQEQRLGFERRSTKSPTAMPAAARRGTTANTSRDRRRGFAGLPGCPGRGAVACFQSSRGERLISSSGGAFQRSSFSSGRWSWLVRVGRSRTFAIAAVDNSLIDAIE